MKMGSLPARVGQGTHSVFVFQAQSRKWAQFVIVIIAKKPLCRKAFPLVFQGIFYFNCIGEFSQQ